MQYPSLNLEPIVVEAFVIIRKTCSMTRAKLFLAVIVFINCLAAGQAVGALQPADLQCEYRSNPLGLDEIHPRLTWQVRSGERGQVQTAYEILVASSEDLLSRDTGDLWDSGKILTNQTVNVVYAGRPLASRMVCYWKVRSWDRQDQPSAWSTPARWSMGLLNSNDWQAEYISFRDTGPLPTNRTDRFLPPAHQYRREFVLDKKIRRATIYATALGIYELHLDGRRVGDAEFAPGWTDYRQRAYYQTYDVTSLLHQGANALGAWVADGWYAGYVGFGAANGLGPDKWGRFIYGRTPAFMAQLEIEYDDGSQATIVTDPAWKVTGDGPIQQADILMGEYYDARKETPGWDRPRFDDSRWESAVRAQDNGSTLAAFSGPPMAWDEPAASAQPGKTGKKHHHKTDVVDLGFHRPEILQAFPGVPVRPIEELQPVAVTSPTNGVYIFNLGQNISGVARLKVKGPAGTKIQLRYGEMLYPDGRLMTENLRAARATDFYILRGDRRGEQYQPRFTFHGFQYVEVTGYPGVPPRDAITGIVIHSDTPPASDFACSDPMPNRLFQNIRWTQNDNFVDIPTDCPQRDERLGWMGDAQTYVRAATYNAYVPAFYTKWLQSVMDAQAPNGIFPGYSPEPFRNGEGFGTAWDDAGVICPWTVWKVYGDTRIIERCWEPMVRFMDWRKSTSHDFLGSNLGNDWGDWLSFGGKTPLDYIDTIYFAFTSQLMSQMAAAIGKTTEADAYHRQFEAIKAAFGKKYVRPDGSLMVDTETAYALALYANLMPDDLRLAAGRILAGKIQGAATADNSGITTGFLGTHPLLPVLTAVGQNDLAVQLFQSHKFPSWGYEVDQGATTIWERWNSYTRDKGFENPGMNSFAHYSFGAVCEWMFSDLAGIDTDGAGFGHIIIRPTPPDAAGQSENPPINWVKAHYDSIHGRISTEWRRSLQQFDLCVSIPANTTATVYLPAKNARDVREGGQSLEHTPGVDSVRQEGDRVVIEIGSGDYHFVVPRS